MSSIQFQKNITIELDDLVNDLDLKSLEQFSSELQQIIARKKVANPKQRELELLEILYRPFPAKAQKRYDELYKALQLEQISSVAKDELLQLVEQSEQHNVKWLEALTELASLRGVSVYEVKKQLNIDNPPVANG